MSNQKIDTNTIADIENFIKKISIKLDYSIEEKKDFEEEMKSNLISSIKELIAQGYSEKEALNIAKERFGNANVIGVEMNNLEEDKKLHFIYRLIGVTVGFVFVLTSILLYSSFSQGIFSILGVITGYVFVIIYMICKHKTNSCKKKDTYSKLRILVFCIWFSFVIVGVSKNFTFKYSIFSTIGLIFFLIFIVYGFIKTHKEF